MKRYHTCENEFRLRTKEKQNMFWYFAQLEILKLIKLVTNSHTDNLSLYNLIFVDVKFDPAAILFLKTIPIPYEISFSTKT